MKLLTLEQSLPLEQCGAKAYRLNQLLKARLPVPPGWVVPVNWEPGVSVGARLPFTTPYAVRSSAVYEDGIEASFAGQYLTVLNVFGAEALDRAVQQVKGSSLPETP
jgi:pyruvate,water dikinase